ncbi:hypothetical protein AG1IA_02545 [Rhizoctonia solani AG-1 IA]|uniref:Uncharacterized protein n=1 Tax=Thanatephorus cucumeris (strain AG1-IA) TaxID=983506 RepID=L8WZL5_THACA|nr:hypothetical protein AG1IA_02545 [Rhizoctonia solani AG-1 IA]
MQKDRGPPQGFQKLSLVDDPEQEIERGRRVCEFGRRRVGKDDQVECVSSFKERAFGLGRKDERFLELLGRHPYPNTTHPFRPNTIGSMQTTLSTGSLRDSYSSLGRTSSTRICNAVARYPLSVLAVIVFVMGKSGLGSLSDLGSVGVDADADADADVDGACGDWDLALPKVIPGRAPLAGVDAGRGVPSRSGIALGNGLGIGLC